MSNCVFLFNFLIQSENVFIGEFRALQFSVLIDVNLFLPFCIRFVPSVL